MVGPTAVSVGITTVYLGILHAGHTVTQEPQGPDWPLVISVVLGIATIAVVSWVAYNQFIA